MSTRKYLHPLPLEYLSSIPPAVPASCCIVAAGLGPLDYAAMIYLCLIAGSAVGLYCLYRISLRWFTRDSPSNANGTKSSPGTPGRSHRLVAGVLLGLIVTGSGAYRLALQPNTPFLSITPRGAIEVTAQAAADLRPSTSMVRTLPVVIKGGRDARRWYGSGRGRVVVMWEGEYTVPLTDRSRRIAPIRGDILTFHTDSERLKTGVVWVDEDDLSVALYDRPIQRIRRELRGAIRRRFGRLNRETRGVMLALLLGDRGSIDPETYDAVRMSGAAHVLALSGMHLGVLAIIVGLLLRRFFSPRWYAIVATIILAFYVWIAGWIPSLLRALSMVVVVTVAQTRSRRLTGPTVLARGIVLLALLHPAVVYELGFQYSVLALAGLMCVTPSLVSALGLFLPRGLALYFGASMGALLLTAPLSISLFGTVYPGGIVMAGALSLVVTVIMWFGVVFTVIGPIPFVGTICASLLEKTVGAFVTLAGVGAHIPAVGIGSPATVSRTIGFGILLALASIGVLLLRHRYRVRFTARKASIGESQLHF